MSGANIQQPADLDDFPTPVEGETEKEEFETEEHAELETNNPDTEPPILTQATGLWASCDDQSSNSLESFASVQKTATLCPDLTDRYRIRA